MKYWYGRPDDYQAIYPDYMYSGRHVKPAHVNSFTSFKDNLNTHQEPPVPFREQLLRHSIHSYNNRSSIYAVRRSSGLLYYYASLGRIRGIVSDTSVSRSGMLFSNTACYRLHD